MTITTRCMGFSNPILSLMRTNLKPRTTTIPTPWLPRTNLRHHHHHHPRNNKTFSTLRFLQNIKTTTTTTTPPKTAAKPPTPTPHFTFAQQLAMRGKPTLLYEAAPQTTFLISSYGAAAFCFGSAVINSWLNVSNLPEGISQWVGVGFGVISIIFAALGTVFALRPTSIIRSITMLPSAGPGQRAMLEIVVRRQLPLPLPTTKMRVLPDQVVMMNRMRHRAVILSQEEMMARKLEEAKRRREEREYEMEHLMTAPFRDARKASSSLFDNIRRGLTGEGFAPVFIKGIRYKLDIDGGYALDEGQVLDRIVRIQDDAELARLQSDEVKDE
ncbi:hypothetical protein GGS20DRAFT_559406 [Poronia punctata]|nr:hypothetical protein GGS20DRAFT_559406 [Poronia punctata]